MASAHPDPGDWQAGAPPTILAEVDAALRRELERWRAAGHDPADPFRGLVLSEADVEDSLAGLEESAGLPAGLAAVGLGMGARLDQLAERFALSELERRVLATCAAIELDSRYEKVVAYLQDDVTRRRPTVDLLLRVHLGSGLERIAARRIFAPDAALVRTGLVALDAAAAEPLLPTPVRIDERVVAHLAGVAAPVDARLTGLVHLATDDRGEALDDARAAAHALLTAWHATGTRAALVLSGPPGSGRRSIARAVAAATGHALLVVDVERLVRAPLAAGLAVTLVLREAALRRAAVCWHGADALDAGGDRPAGLRDALHDALGGGDVQEPMLLTGAARWDGHTLLGAHPALRHDLDVPDAASRLRCWTRSVDAAGLLDERVRALLDDVAAAFRLTPGRISEAAAIAVRTAGARDPDADSVELTAADLRSAARAVSGRGLDTLSREVTARPGWDSLVLPDEPLLQLRELCAAVRRRASVLEDWGLRTRAGTSAGITALFAGAPGTGKTLAAGVVATELGLPLYRIDLANVVSKWLGETEKNLDRVFAAAEDSNAVLLFDEADALFGKRTEVKDAHDRYANVEVSYLLQRMEMYDGAAILATNMRHHLDEAFLRRLSTVVAFPVPDEAQRLRIWRTLWPERMPMGDDVDLARMARFPFAGGNVKNALLAAAALAVEDGTPVGMAHLLHAVRREYQKVGKQLTDSELQP